MGARPGFRPDIEGLRGIAVLLVVLYHAGVPWLPGGFVGVDVFFVLSGYLITRLLLEELRATGSVNLFGFYARRARRLIPAAALTILVTVAVGWLVLSPLAQLQALKTGLSAATYWSNLRFALEAGDYFGADLSRDPLLHTWSLAVEEQFYLAWPLLIAAIAFVAGRRRGGVAWCLALVTAASFAISLWVSEAAPHWAFFGTPARAWEFGVGALAGMVTLRPRLAAALGPVGVLMVIASAFLITEALTWPGSWAVLPVAGTALVLLAGAAAPSSAAPRVLGVRPLTGLGRLSYTWYLWHWPALVLTEAAAGPLELWQRLLVAAGALLTSEVTHRLVENPVRYHRRLVPAPRLAVMLMLGVSLVTTAVAAAAASATERLQLRYVEAARDLPRSHRDGCHLQVPASVPRFDCVYGHAGSETTVVLFGDSHATQWFPTLEAIALERGWRLDVHAKSSCTPATVRSRLGSGEAYVECDQWREAVMASIEAFPPALVVVATYAATGLQPPEAMAVGLSTTLSRLSEAAGAVVYVLDNPAPSFDGPECLSSKGPARCTFDLQAALQPHAWEAAALAGVDVAVVDVTHDVCDSPMCHVERDGEILFRDDHHLTATFAASLSERFEAALPPLAAHAAALPISP